MTRPQPTRAAFAIAVFVCLQAGVWAAAGDRIVAIINEDIVTQAELQRKVREVASAGVRAPDASQLQAIVLQRLIEQKLILQEGKRADIKVTDDDVNAQIDQMKEKAGSTDAFDTWMREAGLSVADLKASIRDSLLAQRTIDAKVRSSISVSPQEITVELKGAEGAPHEPDQVMASHILVRVGNGRTEEEAKQRIAEIQSKLATGASFEDLAIQYSDDSHADSGGKLGWMTPGQLLPELDEALFKLDPGQVSEVIPSRLGFHLLKVTEKRNGAQLSAVEANHAAFKKIYDRKFQVALAKWLDDLKKQAYIQIPEG